MADIYRTALTTSLKASHSNNASALMNEVAAVARRRWKVFAIAMGSMLALLLLFTITTKKTYTTDAGIIVGMAKQPTQTPDSATNLPILNALMVVSGVQSGETYAELLTESPVARSVIDTLNLNMTPRELLNHIKAEPINNTSMIRISATWSSPQMSAQIANGFANAFVDRERSLITSQADSALQFLTKEMPDAARRQKIAEAAMIQFEKSHHAADIGAQATATLASLNSVEARIGQLMLDRRQQAAQLKADDTQMASMQATTAGSESQAPNPVVQQLRTQLADVETQLGAARRTYTERYPLVVSLEAQHARLLQEIAQQPATIVAGTSTVPNPIYQQLSQAEANYRTQIAADDAGLTELGVQRKQLLTQTKSLPDDTLRFSALQRDAKQAEAVYDALQQRMSDALVAKSTAIGDVTITQQASADDAVAKPSRVMTLAIGLIVSLILAGSLVALLEWLDRRPRGEEELRASFGRHILGYIPDLSWSDQQSRPTLEAMAFESLLQIVRTLQCSNGRGARSIAFTSPGAGDGKSTVAVNMGRTLAEFEGPVLLIDGDLRRPSLHKLLHVENELGLADLLGGKAKFAESVKATSTPNLDVITSGIPVSSPAHLLQTSDFKAVLKEAEERGYRVVIVDLPAVLPVVDAALLADKVDGTVLVVSADTTGSRSTREVISYVKSIGIDNLLGLIVNRVRRESPGENGYYLTAAARPLALR
jgi:capsular exopolysaccharide synthesis family protein